MQRPELHREKGATLVIVAATLMLLFGVAALAVDLSALRADIRSDQLATDAAATAGAIHINPFSGSSADEACEAAWEYLLLNLEGAVGALSPPSCGTFVGACGATVARETTATAGPHTIRIIHPVLDGSTLMAGQAINPDFDGASCQRLGVEVTKIRDFSFARVLGIGSGTTTVSSVARIAIDAGEPEVVPLLVLEPWSCDALYTSGQGKITVAHFMDTPGIIVVDSDGSKTSNPNACIGASNWTIYSSGNLGWIRALPVPSPDNIPSAILSFALSGAPGANPARSYDPGDLISPATGVDPSDPPESAFQLYPRPQPSFRRITRAPIDWRYNCKTSYPLYLGSVTVDPCPGTFDPRIDNVVANYGGVGSPMGIFQRWTNSESCSVDSSITVSGDWWVDCPGGFIVNGVNVVFENGDVVFDGTVDLRSSGSLTVNTTSTDRVAYIRGTGNLIKTAQASISLNQTFVYMEGGRIDLVGGTGGLTWTAPVSGDFEDLALWAEAELEFQIGGQAGNSLTGTFFTPLSNPFILTGQGGQFQTSAQFLTRRLEVTGQGEVLMHPDPSRQTLIPTRAVRLIR